MFLTRDCQSQRPNYSNKSLASVLGAYGTRSYKLTLENIWVVEISTLYIANQYQLLVQVDYLSQST